MKLIVGLGNPEKKYTNTRHNFGFLVLDELSNNLIDKKNWHCQIAKTEQAIFCKPLTYMNASGRAVKAVADYYKIKSYDVVIIHDDLDLPLGTLRLGVYSSSAGHNGIKSIQQAIGKDFIRLRLGIGRPTTKQMVSDYVLKNFSQKEKSLVKNIIKQAKIIINELLTSSLTETQNKFN
jgi:PTH1 family peptidyl-tRNA hydrolase